MKEIHYYCYSIF